MSQLLTLAYLNEACFLSLNESDTKYLMCLKMSQETLKDTLGRELFEQIESQYPAFTGASDNETLYNGYIKDFLAWQTYFNYLKFANFNPTPTGIRTFKDENSDIASDIQMFSLEKHVSQEAKSWKYRMLNFLKEAQLNDSTKYSLYVDKCRDEMSFAITSVDKRNNTLIQVNKTIITNE